ncbi:MAG: M1 family metallopeptidase [Bacteroidota bacterium]
MRPALLLAVLLFVPTAHAQQAAPWQQAVAYEMDIHLQADRHRVLGEQRLVYTNNAPDTLRQVYYHLYFNAFHPGSMMAERNRALPDPDRRVVPRIFNLGPEEVGWHRVRSLTQDGAPVAFRVEDTVLEVDLARPILPGGSAVFEMEFESQVPLQTRRSGRDSREGIDYSMTQWYPKMAAYDAVGWHADPYIGREFYAPFGTFDVRLTLPADYVVGATGVLQNPEAVGHGYDQPPGLGPVAPGPASAADSLTWHFRAEQVHDFAWAADPDYLHETLSVTDVPGRTEPVTLHLLYQPDVAENWAQLGARTAELTRYFSARFGTYPWPQFTVVQGGDGGMEYPMATLITGRRSPLSALGVTTHEFAHMWFYGVVATNETDFAWMDEGFTSFATTEGVRHVLATEGLAPPGPPSHAGARARIAQLQRLGLYERPNTPSDWFETNTAYGAASYSAGRVLADLLGYVAGDAVRDEILREYVRRFSFRHPYPADVLAVAQDVSGLQLDWLFEQLLDGGVRYDYAAAGLDVERANGQARSAVTLERREPGVLPVDLRLRFADGSERMVTVPPTVMRGQKAVPEGWTVAAPWPWTSETYTLTVEGDVREVLLDPERRMLDLDESNHRLRRFGSDRLRRFAGLYAQPTPTANATTYALSSITAYSHDYGVGVGAQLRTALPNGRGTLQLGLTLWPQVIADENQGFDLEGVFPDVLPSGDPFPVSLASSGDAFESSPLDGIDYTAVYTRQLFGLGPLDDVRFEAQKHLGILENRVSLTKVLGRYPTLRRWDHSLTFTLGHQHRVTGRAFEDFDAFPTRLDTRSGLTFPDAFGLDTGFGEDHLVSARLDYRIGDARGEVTVTGEIGGAMGIYEDSAPAFAVGSEFNANRLWMTATKATDLGPFEGVARLALGIGSDRLSPQKRFRLGASSVETAWRSDAYRVLAAVPDDPQRDGQFFALSGIGPVAYLVREPSLTADGIRLPRSNQPTSGTSLIAGSLALRLGPARLLGLSRSAEAVLAPLRLEVFSGFGGVTSDFAADAGLGVRYDLGALAPLARASRLAGLVAQSDVLRGLHLVAKFPVWASEPDRIGPDEEAFGFRWLVGIEAGL